MSEICIFAGTTEGRELVEYLLSSGAKVYACTATEYGGTLLSQAEGLTVSAQRLTEEEMEQLFREHRFDAVVDATHPYAPIVTENIQSACKAADTKYLRLLRTSGGVPQGCIYCEDTQAAVERLKTLPGSILLTTGSKEIAAYAQIPEFAQRVYARVLPVESSIASCREAGLPVSHILAMQGPFSEEMNLAMLKSIQAGILVTKDSGDKGGFLEKAEAAEKAGCTLLVIGRPRQVEGLSFLAVAQKLGYPLEKQVSIVGIGPGDRENRTLAADRAIREAECIIGARRMLEAAALPGQQQVEAIAPEKIAAAIQENQSCRRFAVVMAGDVGFYSGTKKLLPLLSGCKVELLPGISSLVMLCARLGVSYEDVVTVSLHGRQGNIAPIVAKHSKVFALVGGEDGMAKLCKQLMDAGLENVRLSVGECLGYPDEKITVGTPAELAEKQFQSLSVALIQNEIDPIVTHGMPDEAFQRGSHADGTVVPMTKSEIRWSALSHLQLREDSVCWDIGAGTGSVAIEMALQASRGSVYAVEKKEGALALLAENRRKHHAGNLTIVPGAAPDCCAELPAPTHVFIGGSSGNIRSILELAREKNPNVRIVATAIALETVAELVRCKQELGFRQTEVVTLSAAQNKDVGPYSLMQGQNPVYLFTFVG